MKKVIMLPSCIEEEQEGNKQFAAVAKCSHCFFPAKQAYQYRPLADLIQAAVF
jgi:hypothetical protein